MGKKNFQVAIMHGHSQDFLAVKNYVNECNFSARILLEEYSADTIFENLRNLIWDHVHCVIVILTMDDEMANGNKRARQNVVFELGYCFGAFDSLPEIAPYKPKDALVIVAEEGVELFADIDGLTKIMYEKGNIEAKKEVIMGCLQRSYKKAKSYYVFDAL